jgi:hypothetical protein
MRNFITYRNKKYRVYSGQDVFGSEANRVNLLLALGIYISSEGYLFLEHWNRNKRAPIFHRFQSIAKAISSQDHILADYILSSEEGPSEHATFSSGENLFKKILGDLTKGTSIEDTINPDALKNMHHELSNSRLLLKEKLQSQLEKLMEPLDSLGRPNPCAKLAIASSASIKSEKRLIQIETSMNLARRRREALILESNFMMNNLNQAFVLQKSLDTSNPQNPDELRQIGRIKYLLQSVWLYPLREEANKLREMLPK